MKIPEKIEFKFIDLLPLFAVWNEQNKNLVRQALALGFFCGAIIGYLTGQTSWGRPFYYSWYFGISTEAYAIILAVKIVEKRHTQHINVWLLPWLKFFYWLFFFLLVNGAVMLLETINFGTPWFVVIKSCRYPNGIAYSNTLTGILIGIVAAFPSKIILQILSLHIFKFKLPFPFDEFAELTIEKGDKLLQSLSSRHKQNDQKLQKT